MTLTAALPKIATQPAPVGWHLPNRPVLITYLRYAGITGLLFVLCYGGANWLAAQRAIHYRLYWDWELAIPLWPPAIWPYLSINVLFLLPLLRLDAQKTVWLGRRMILATLIAGAIYLAFPTTVAFARLDTSDGASPAYRLLYAICLPYNCVPSLHVTYSALIMAAVARRAGAWLRLALSTWLLLIIAATLLTHQHHLIDALAALVFVAWLCHIGKDARP